MSTFGDDGFDRLTFAYSADVDFMLGGMLFYHHLFLHLLVFLNWLVCFWVSDYYYYELPINIRILYLSRYKIVDGPMRI